MKKGRDKMTKELLTRLVTRITQDAFVTNCLDSNVKASALDQPSFREVFSLLDLVRKNDELWQIACDRLRWGLFLNDSEEESNDQASVRPHLVA